MNKVKLDEVDHQILDILIDNTRVPFTDISKRLFISAGTVHVRVKKMEEAGIIKGSSLNLDYVKLGYSYLSIMVWLHIACERRVASEFIPPREDGRFVHNDATFSCLVEEHGRQGS